MTNPVFATPPPETANSVASFALLGGIVAGFRRQLPIGGWLFFFFWGIFVGLAVTLVTLFGERVYLLPTRWENQTKYLLYMLSLGPRLASLIFVAAASAMALSRRNSHAVLTLRMALAAYVISQFVTGCMSEKWHRREAVCFQGYLTAYRAVRSPVRGDGLNIGRREPVRRFEGAWGVGVGILRSTAHSRKNVVEGDAEKS